MTDANHKDIKEDGNEAMATIYDCKYDLDLNFERASKFMEKVASSSCYLPPEHVTSIKSCQTTQKMEEQACQGNSMEPTKWG